MIIDVGERQYELVEGWGEVPDGWIWGQVGAVCVDSQDNVHAFTRAEHPYRVFDKSGDVEALLAYCEGLGPARRRQKTHVQGEHQ